MIAENVLKVWNAEHVEAVQVHQLFQGIYGGIMGHKDGVFFDATQRIGTRRTGELHGITGRKNRGAAFIARPRLYEVGQGKGIYGDGADHAELGLKADAGIEIIDARDIECDHAHACAFVCANGLVQVKVIRIVPWLAGLSVGDAVYVVRALKVDKCHGFSGEDGQF